MDPVTAIAAIEAVRPMIDELKFFLEKIGGPSATEYGLILADKVQLFRLKNLLREMKSAEKMIKEAGYEAKQIPVRTLLPIVETASFEDDDFLSEKWAALLANAAIGEENLSIHPSFPKILSDLEPNEARLLDEVFQKHPSKWPEARTHFAGYFNVSIQRINEYYDNLFRLGLLRLVDKEMYVNGDRIHVLDISPFGERFVLACRAPKRKV